MRVIEATPEELIDITVAPKPGTEAADSAASEETAEAQAEAADK